MSNTTAVTEWREIGDVARASSNLEPSLWTDERIRVIWKAVAPSGSTIEELSVFLAVANRYDLDPLIGEIFMAKIDGKNRPLVGRDGLLAIASRDPGFLGVQSGVVREGDEFEILTAAGETTITHRIHAGRGDIVSAFAVAFHRSKKPVVFVRDLAYYSHLKSDTRRRTWQHYEEDMLETRCIAGALRRMFKLSGVYTQAEWDLKDEETPLDIAGSRTAASRTVQKAAELATVVAGKRGVSVHQPGPMDVPDPQDEADEEPVAVSRDDASRLELKRKMFFAFWNERAPVEDPESEFERREWQEAVTGKHSQKDWDLGDYDRAIAELESLSEYPKHEDNR